MAKAERTLASAETNIEALSPICSPKIPFVFPK